MHNDAYRCNIVFICSIMQLYNDNVMSSLPQSMIIILSQEGRPQGYNKQYDSHLAFHKAQTGAGSNSFVKCPMTWVYWTSPEIVAI